MKFFLISLLFHLLVFCVPWSNFIADKAPSTANIPINFQVSSASKASSAGGGSTGKGTLATPTNPSSSQLASTVKSNSASRTGTLASNLPLLPSSNSNSLEATTTTTSSATTGSESASTQLGTASGSSNQNGSGSGSASGSGTNGFGDNFASNGDGTYTALSSSGIDYQILVAPEPSYPEEARALGYSRSIRVEAELLVGLNGQVETVQILNSVPNLGFRESAKQALLNWRFAPIYYQGVNIKMRFTKNIYFDPQ